MAEMKGAFDRNKAPTGIQASFIIGGMPVQLDAPAAGNTLTVEASPRRSSANAKQTAEASQGQGQGLPF